MIGAMLRDLRYGGCAGGQDDCPIPGLAYIEAPVT
jgi:hypothetical protein